MKLIVLHGLGNDGARRKLSDIKKEFPQNATVYLDGKDLSEKELLTNLSQESLFSEEKLIIIENPPALNLAQFVSDERLSLVLHFPKTLPSNSVVLKELLKYRAQIFSFPEEKEESIFPFLDSLITKNPKALSLLTPLFAEYGSQYLFTMMAFSLRRLVAPAKTLPPFVLKKIEEQRKNFSLERIKELYRAILITDFKIKSGILDEEIATQLLSQRFFE